MRSTQPAQLSGGDPVRRAVAATAPVAIPAASPAAAPAVAPAAAPTAAEAQREQALHEQLEQQADAMLGDVHRRLRQPPREVSVPHKPAHALAHMPMHRHKHRHRHRKSGTGTGTCRCLPTPRCRRSSRPRTPPLHAPGGAMPPPRGRPVPAAELHGPERRRLLLALA